MKLTIISKSPEQTEEAAENIASRFKGGEVIELVSELGGGKTTFVHGLARGIHSKDKVASPTFSISRLYNGKGIDLYHFDFYRLAEPGIIKNELSDILQNNKNVVVIEWPEMIVGVLPADKLTIKFEYISENTRKILFTYPESLSYLIGNVNSSHTNR